MIRIYAFYVLLVFAIQGTAAGQTTPSTLTLKGAVEAALARYPSLRVSEAQARSAASAIKLARTAYLPSLDLVGGINRATRNNVLGLLLPSQVIAPISGPVLGTNNLGSAWGSTVGFLITWEPFDFGRRSAEVAVAEASQVRAQAGVNRTRLELATMAADAFLTVLAAEQTALAAQAAVDRSVEFERITDALVRAELRPGVESTLAKSENASAQAQLIRARQAIAEAQANLTAFVGSDAGAPPDPGKLLSVAPELAAPSPLELNAIAVEQHAAIKESLARIHLLDREYFPRFSIQGTAYARGTGALPDRRLLGGVNGLGPNIQNWGIGFTAEFPILSLPSVRARKNVEAARTDAERSRYDQILRDLQGRRDAAVAAAKGAEEVAKVAPVAVEAASALVQQAKARYQSGLGTALDVAEAQRRLAQAEIDQRLARLSVWRAHLAYYAAQGDIAPWLAEASN